MRTLSYEVVINIARFLEPKDLRSLSFSGRAYMPICRDEYLFRMLYDRDYKKYCQDFSPLLENISSWKKLYTTLHINKIQMIVTMQKYFGFKKDDTINRKKIFYVTTNGIIEDRDGSHTFVDYGYQEEHIVETGKKTLRFNPDMNKVLAIRHMNLAHQVFKVDQELGRRGDTPYMKGPPGDEHIRFLEEGVCLWREKDETYRLIYPYQAIKLIFEECKFAVTNQYMSKVESLREFFQQIISISYKISKKNMKEIIKGENMKEGKGESEEIICVGENLFRGLFEEYDLHVFEHTCDEGILQVTCSRKPRWTYNMDMCVYSAHEYDQKQQKHVEINCKNKSVKKGYCEEHTKPYGHSLQKYHRKQREKLRNEEYINYIEKPLPKILTLKEAILTQHTYTILD